MVKFNRAKYKGLQRLANPKIKRQHCTHKHTLAVVFKQPTVMCKSYSDFVYQ